MSLFDERVPILPLAGADTDVFRPVQAQVRRRGVFETVFEGEPGVAFLRGLERARKTPAVSVRLRRGGQTISPALLGLSVPGDFRPSKSEANVLVEKRKKRIDTPGELFGITGKGLSTIASNRNILEGGFL